MSIDPETFTLRPRSVVSGAEFLSRNETTPPENRSRCPIANRNLSSVQPQFQQIMFQKTSSSIVTNENYSGMKTGGGRLYRLFSNRTLGIGGPAGAIRGYDVVESNTLARVVGGFHAVAVAISRWRFGAGDTCCWTVVTTAGDAESKDANRVASFTVRAQTATTTTNAQPRWRQSYP